MEPIRVAWGTGTGPTSMAAYDAALGAAGVADYNLVGLSSVVPPGAEVEAVGTAPDLGETGDCLHVVEASGVGRGATAAALGWVETPEGGLFYEHGRGADVAGGSQAGIDPAAVEHEVREGLAAGAAQRGWADGDVTVRSVDAAADEAGYVAAVVVAAFGEAEPLL